MTLLNSRPRPTPYAAPTITAKQETLVSRYLYEVDRDSCGDVTHRHFKLHGWLAAAATVAMLAWWLV